ncbi:ABC-2 type transport system permease protein [Lipingzhangella halophila]|uniref:ABC-2 type transport system permease protein n=1 Tax=Lipingzhangella halophila TaxID=1783352 RepID=A0A7W7W5W9_9ACTN|nr:ABC transporter permease [Lipingzhangella halophila]MBB4934289.1 ABC-2 type transport system permease protein [Lipingzhangella halophila]
MNPKLHAVRFGLARGGLELRQTFTNVQDLWTYIFMPLVMLVVLTFMRGNTVPGTDFSMGAMALPSIAGMFVAFGMVTAASALLIEREDGTLLRAKAIPDGMLGYLVGKLSTVTGMTLVSLLVFLVPALFLVDGVAVGGLGRWLQFTAVFVFGLLAVLPIGAVIGSLFSNPRNMGYVMLPVMGLVAISGIFYPVTQLPVFLQWIAQVFPIYWLGLGMRAALLPDAMAAVELGESWRHVETAGVLGVWIAAGLIVAPIVLRRMARRESGSAVQARKEKAIQRVA